MSKNVSIDEMADAINEGLRGRVLIHRLSASCIRKLRTSVQTTLCTTISIGWTLRCTPIIKTRIWKRALKKS